MVKLPHITTIIGKMTGEVNEYRGKNRNNTKKVHSKRVDLLNVISVHFRCHSIISIASFPPVQNPS